VDRVYIAMPVERSAEVADLQRELLERNVDIIWAPDIFALNLLNPCVREIAGVPLISLSESPLSSGGRAFLKSVMDVFIASAVLLVAAPLMLAVAIAIKATSRGPVFFRQQRHGWDGSVFEVWKFRSMYLHDDERVNQATRDDPRITPVGRFIRRTSIDELPQLFNVLNGTMSLVGPRPHAIAHNLEYGAQITAYMARHRVKPGITGWAQIHGYRGETDTLEKMHQRVRLDLEYINNWSLRLDLWILIRTPFALLSENAY
jgi:putative colanic acid biosynthesis UDP-glucose lipid carrier transferase